MERHDLQMLFQHWHMPNSRMPRDHDHDHHQGHNDHHYHPARLPGNDMRVGCD